MGWRITAPPHFLLFLAVLALLNAIQVATIPAESEIVSLEVLEGVSRSPKVLEPSPSKTIATAEKINPTHEKDSQAFELHNELSSHPHLDEDRSQASKTTGETGTSSGYSAWIERLKGIFKSFYKNFRGSLSRLSSKLFQKPKPEQGIDIFWIAASSPPLIRTMHMFDVNFSENERMSVEFLEDWMKRINKKLFEKHEDTIPLDLEVDIYEGLDHLSRVLHFQSATEKSDDKIGRMVWTVTQTTLRRLSSCIETLREVVQFHLAPKIENSQSLQYIQRQLRYQGELIVNVEKGGEEAESLEKGGLLLVDSLEKLLTTAVNENKEGIKMAALSLLTTIALSNSKLGEKLPPIADSCSVKAKQILRDRMDLEIHSANNLEPFEKFMLHFGKGINLVVYLELKKVKAKLPTGQSLTRKAMRSYFTSLQKPLKVKDSLEDSGPKLSHVQSQFSTQ